MKRWRYLIVVVVLLVLSVAFWPHYFVRTVLDPYVNVLSNSKEAFIYLGQMTTGQSGPIVGILLEAILDNEPRIYEERDDLLLIHIGSAGDIRRSSMRKFSFSGGLFPMNGVIYYALGDSNGNEPKVWRWGGTTFVRLDHSEASKILGSFKYTSDLIKAEGWQETRIKFNGSNVVSSFPLNSGKCVLSLAERPAEGNIVQIIKARGEGFALPEQVLIEQDGKSKAVSRSEYSEQIER